METEESEILRLLAPIVYLEFEPNWRESSKREGRIEADKLCGVEKGTVTCDLILGTLLEEWDQHDFQSTGT
jgi:hypothetical protein